MISLYFPDTQPTWLPTFTAYATVLLLTEKGFDVELIPKSNVEGVHNPDIRMQGLLWEIKSPVGSGKYVLKNILHKASHQSENVIIDLRRCKLPNDKCVNELEFHFSHISRLRRMKIITKSKNLLDFSK